MKRVFTGSDNVVKAVVVTVDVNWSCPAEFELLTMLEMNDDVIVNCGYTYDGSTFTAPAQTE